MKNMSLLKIALVSLSFLSVSAFSIKLFEIHLHLGASASTQVASPLFKVEPNAKFSDHWEISVPNDGQWHDTGLVVPSNKEFVSFSPITTGDNIEHTAIRIGTQEYPINPTTKPTTGYYIWIRPNNQALPIALKNSRGQANDIYQLRIWFGNTVWTETHSKQ